MAGQPFAVGTSGGTVGKVTMYNPDRSVRFTATPFGTSYTGAVKVAEGDVTGDGVADVVAVADGNGQAPTRVAVINGATLSVSTPMLLPSVYAGRVSVSVGDVNKDGVGDIALGTEEGGARVRVFRGGDLAKLADFLVPGGSGFAGGTEVSLADVTGDGAADLNVSARYGNVTKVFGYSGTSLAPGQTPTAAFAQFALYGTSGAGVNLAAGDLNGDGYADLVFGSYGGQAASVKVYSGKSLSQSNSLYTLASFTPTGANTNTGVKVAVRDVNGDGRADLLTSSGELVNAYSGTRLSLSLRPPMLFSFDADPNVQGGVSIG